MLPVHVAHDQIRIGRHFAVDFQRTLRIPDDGGTYPLPPGLGRFPVFRVADYADRVPTDWRERGGVFIPMYQREALWLNFSGAAWRPNAVKVAIGKVNALSGKSWVQALGAGRQDYMVVPEQPWLDGINGGDGYIKQFVAMPLGMGYTVEGQLTGEERFGGVQLIAYDPRPGRFPDEPPVYRPATMEMAAAPCAAPAMGLGAGGRMKQEIHPDPHGIDTWDPDSFGRVYVHIVNSMAFREITGLEPPPTPVSARAYTESGLPWFDLDAGDGGDIEPAGEFDEVKSISEQDAQNGFGCQQDDAPVNVPDGQVVPLGGASVADGNW